MALSKNEHSHPLDFCKHPCMYVCVTIACPGFALTRDNHRLVPFFIPSECLSTHFWSNCAT